MKALRAISRGQMLLVGVVIKLHKADANDGFGSIIVHLLVEMHSVYTAQAKFDV